MPSGKATGESRPIRESVGREPIDSPQDRLVPRRKRATSRGKEHSERASRIKAALPKDLKPLFWEYDFRQLSWEADSDLITSRVLASGDWKAISWLRQKMAPDVLRRWIVEHRGRGLDPPRLRFWELILGLPRRQVNEWLSEMRRDPWLHRWKGA